MWVSVNMAFKLTYTDGQESDYDDGTKWKVEDGVLKLGREEGNWSVFVSPGHWATIEIGNGAKEKKDGEGNRDTNEKKDDKDEKDEKDDKAEKDNKDDKED